MRTLTQADVTPAVIGGTILGGGGGGHVSMGLDLARSALEAGEVRLIEIDELAPDAIVAICAGVGAPGAPDAELTQADFVASLDLLNAELKRRGRDPIAAVATNENGAMGTVNAWLQGALTGLPVVDCPCNGRAHPTAVMGSLGLHRDASYESIAGFAGGPAAMHVAGVVVGSLDTTSKSVRSLSVVAGGLVAVARNPVPAIFLRERGAPGAIAQAIAVGEAHASGGVEAVATMLGGEVVSSGRVTGFHIEQVGGFDVGRFSVGDVSVTLVNEYMDAVRDEAPIATFPDLVMTFDAATGAPVVSAHLSEGMDVRVLVVPQSALRLSATMGMPELMEPIRDLLNRGTPNAG